MTINLKSVWTSAVRFGSGEQQIACGGIETVGEEQYPQQLCVCRIPSKKILLHFPPMGLVQIALARPRPECHRRSYSAPYVKIFGRS